MKEYPITDLCSVIRSKQAGPFRLTIDLLFKTEAIYNEVKNSEAITPHFIASLYNIPESEITNFVYYDPGQALKITMVRPHVAGSPGDSDVYGCQQHAPLLKLNLELPEEVLLG